MKKLILALLLLVSTSFVFAQNIVDIKLTDLTPTNCQITLYPSDLDTSILSNVVFTLRWKSNQNIVLGNPQSTNLINVVKAGPIRTNGSWKYQVYYGCGFNPDLIQQPITLNIPKTGSGKISIADDEYSQQLNVNGKYYVSIGGQDVTGSILIAKNIELEESSPVIMYFDPLNRQFYVKRDNQYYNMMGQKVTLYNITELTVVRKSDL